MTSMYTQTEKRQFTIYLLVAFGFTYLMGLFMWFGYGKGMDVSAFAAAQMMYPAAGVALAYLMTKKDDSQMPKGFYWFFIILTVLMAICSVVSMFVLPGSGSEGSTGLTGNLIVQGLMIAGSSLGWIALFISGKAKREAYGLRWKNTKSSWFCIFLFIGLYFLRTAFAYGVSGEIGIIPDTIKNPLTWISIASLPINFFLVFAVFFGEEYGWRYYMQPFLQRKFGLKGGVLLLGVVWGLWHLPLDFLYYTTPQMGLIAAVSQQITCIFLGIFFAYAYMKTNNIWVPVVLHYLNNNLVPVITGDYSAQVLENQQMSWAQIPASLLINLLFFGVFLFIGPFKKEKQENDTLAE